MGWRDRLFRRGGRDRAHARAREKRKACAPPRSRPIEIEIQIEISLAPKKERKTRASLPSLLATFSSRKARAVRPRPGRVVVFAGPLKHAARPPLPDCHLPRLSLALKWRLRDVSAPPPTPPPPPGAAAVPPAEAPETSPSVSGHFGAAAEQKYRDLLVEARPSSTP